MISRHTSAALLCLTALSACTTLQQDNSSRIAGVSVPDAQALSIQASDILTASMDPRQTTLRVLRFIPANASVQQTLDNALRARGFALAPDGMPYPGALTIHLDLQAIPQHLLMTVHAGDGEMTCSYVHDTAGQLVRKSGCTLLEGTAVTLRAPQVQTIPVTASFTTQPARTVPAVIAPEPISSPISPVYPSGINTTEPTTRQYPVPTQTPAPLPETQNMPSAPDPARQWVLTHGEPIREQVIAWGAQVGWIVEWPEDINWNIPATAVFTGDFEDKEHGPIEQIVDALAEQGRAIKVNFHFPNKTLVITHGDVR